jgi:hypothetical protein
LLTSYAVRRSGIAGLTLHYLSFEAMRELAQGTAAVIDGIDRLNSTQQAADDKWQSGCGGAVKLWAAANLWARWWKCTAISPACPPQGTVLARSGGNRRSRLSQIHSICSS